MTAPVQVTMTAPNAATSLIAMRMPESMCYRLLRELRHCSLEDDAPELGGADLAGDEGSAEFDLIMHTAPFSANFNPEEPIDRAEFFGGAVGPQIVLYEQNSEMVHLIVRRPSERLVRLGKSLLDEAYAALNGKAA